MAITPKGHILDLRTDLLNQALDFVQRQDAAGAIGLYVGNNPLDMRVGGPDKSRPNNQSVSQRRSLFFDFDRAGTPKHLATDDELAEIHAARQYAQHSLTTRLAFPTEASRSGLSGNGEYLIYETDRLSVNIETNTLIQSATRALRTILAVKHPTVHLDAVHEPVRVRRISGTINRKYDKHRMCTLAVHDQEPVTREMLEALAALAPVEQQPARPRPTWSGAGMTNDELLAKAFSAKNGEKIRRLYEGDTSGYQPSQSDPGFSSEADQALVNYLCGYTPDDDQLADLWRTSGLYRKKLDRTDYVERTIQQARKGQSWAYDPNNGTTPRLTVVPKTPPPDNADPETRTIAELLAEIDQKDRLLAQKDEQIIILQEHIRRRDERDAIKRNTKLGAPRNTGAVLANIFQEEQPKKPDAPAGYRMPLAKLADRTGLSTDTCSDHIKKLAGYKTPEGTPVLYAETLDIPRTVIQETGEIIEAHREVWVGPGIDPAEFGALLATLVPDNAPKHGGAADRNVCPDCPDADVIRRSRNLRRITYECSCCRKVLNVEVIPVGRETTQQVPTVNHPEAMPHDAALGEADPGGPEHSASPPMRQHAASIDNHTRREHQDLSGKMRHSSPPPPLTEPAWLWDSPAGEAGNDGWTA